MTDPAALHPLPAQDWGVIGDGFCLDGSGQQVCIITVGTKQMRFEFSERFGPLFVGRANVPLENQNPPKFLRAVSLWAVQGRRMSGDNCVWHEPKRPVTKHIGGRRYKIIEDGEVGWDW